MTTQTATSGVTTVTASTPAGTYFLTGNLMSESQLATCGAELAKSAGKNKPTPIPTFRSSKGVVMYMPGAGFRSKLRGAACALILEALQTRGARRFNLKDAQLNRVGGIKQAGSESNLDRQAYNAMVRANPILGVFGAATPWVKGKAMVGHVSCIQGGLEPMRVEGVRADIVRREPTMVEFLAEGSLDAYQAEISKVQAYSAIKSKRAMQDALLKRGTPEEKKLAKEIIAGFDKQIADQKMKANSPLMPLAGYLAIPPQTELENQVALVRVSQIELGCFIASLARFAEEPVLGAHVAHGAGIISGEWQVHKTGVGKIGSLILKPFVGLDIQCDELQKAKAAFEEFIASDECIPYADENILAPETVDDEATGNE